MSRIVQSFFMCVCVVQPFLDRYVRTSDICSSHGGPSETSERVSFTFRDAQLPFEGSVGSLWKRSLPAVHPPGLNSTPDPILTLLSAAAAAAVPS